VAPMIGSNPRPEAPEPAVKAPDNKLEQGECTGVRVCDIDTECYNDECLGRCVLPLGHKGRHTCEMGGSNRADGT
jgi:hypothetical protein